MERCGKGMQVLSRDGVSEEERRSLEEVSTTASPAGVDRGSNSCIKTSLPLKGP